MSEISVTVNGSTTINPTVGNGDTVSVTIASTGERGPTGSTGSAGPANTLAIGTVTSGTAAATITGTAPSQTLNLVLQAGATGATGSVGATGSQGPAGPANSLSIGTVTSGTAAATITGTSPNQTLNLVLQKGDTGAQGPAGVTGPAANLADETPQPLGTASAGTALSAARADHVHSQGSITYSALSGIPVSFTPSPHSHAVSDVTGLQTALDGKQVAGSYAPLINNQVPSANLPSFVDDVIEYANLAAFTEQSTGKIYVARDTGKIYRWSGSAYIEISPSPGSTDSVTEGSTNLYHTTIRAAAAAPVQSVAGRTGTVTLAKADVGLGSVDNTADTAKPISTATQTALDGKAATSHTHSLANITQSSATTGQVPTWNGTAWSAETPSGGGSSYTLPTASSSVLGGIKVGSGLAIASGVLSVTATVTPSAPQSVAAISSGTQNDSVSWSAPAVGSAATYEVQQADDGVLPYRTIGTTSSTTFSLVGLTRNSQDKFRVRGITSTGVPGDWGYTANAPVQNEFSIFEATTAAGFPATGSAGTLYHATNVRRIYFWDASGVYVEAGTSGGTGEDTTLRTLFTPGAPTSVTPTGGNAQVALTWSAPTVSAQTPITDYVVQFSSNSGSTWTTFSDGTSTSTSATVTGLTNGTAYTFRVAAVNGVGTGAYSTASSAVTPAAAAGVTVLSGSASGSGTNTITATAQGNISVSVPSTRTLTWTGSPGQYIAGPQQAGFSFDSEVPGGWYRNFTGSSFSVIAGTYTTENTSNGATLTFTP